MNATPLERELLAHRFLYYAEGQPIISDFEYDRLELRLIRETGKDMVETHGVGSSLASSYSPEVIARARQMVMEPETMIRE